MEKFHITTDSGCDLPFAFCRERKIFAYRMKYTIDEREYIDSMDPEDCVSFYNKMRSGAVPHTSQMTPYEFISFWSDIYERSNLPIVHIAMGSAISGTYTNALIAKELFLESHPKAQIFVVDSTLASIGYGMLCVVAADMRDLGKTPEECVNRIESLKILINTYYTTDELKYLYRSGRVRRAEAIVATTLRINPILNLDKEGHLIVQEKIMGRKRAIKRIIEIVKERVTDPSSQTVYICHSDLNAEEVDAFSKMLIDRIGFKDSFISYIGPTIGSHSGPGLIAAFFIGKPREEDKI